MRRTSPRFPCPNPYSSSKYSHENNHSRLKTRKTRRVSRECHQKGVQRTKSGKYASIIWDRIKKKCVWLGTFSSAKEAGEVYNQKKKEFEDQQEPAKIPKEDDFPNSEKNTSLSQQEVTRETHDDSRGVKESVKFVLRRISIDHRDGDDGASKRDAVKEEKDQRRFGYFNGVQICDEYGNMVGEFAYIDDLSFC